MNAAAYRRMTGMPAASRVQAAFECVAPVGSWSRHAAIMPTKGDKHGQPRPASVSQP